MASQKKNNMYRSKAVKYSMATCEKSELRKIIELALASYSKYSTKKKKQSIKANVNMLKKKPDTSSKHKTSENSGKVETENKSPKDKKKILSVTCKYLIKKSDATNSTQSPKRQISAEISSSNHREKKPKNETTKTPCTSKTANMLNHPYQNTPPMLIDNIAIWGV